MDVFSAALKNIKQRQDDDFTDRMNYYYTSTLILLFSLVVSMKQWIGQP